MELESFLNDDYVASQTDLLKMVLPTMGLEVRKAASDMNHTRDATIYKESRKPPLFRRLWELDSNKHLAACQRQLCHTPEQFAETLSQPSWEIEEMIT